MLFSFPIFAGCYALQFLERAAEGGDALEAAFCSYLFQGVFEVLLHQGMLFFFQLDDPILCQVRDEILGLDVNNLTPLEALNKLNDIKKIVFGK